MVARFASHRPGVFVSLLNLLPVDFGPLVDNSRFLADEGRVALWTAVDAVTDSFHPSALAFGGEQGGF